jgi:protein-disulfide isomerase
MKALVCLALALTLASCSRAEDDKAFGDRVRAYLIAHPEVLLEVQQAYEAKLSAAKADIARKQIPKLKAALEHDSRDFVANPNGKVTVVEFFDYRCPHCVNAAPKVAEMIRAYPNVRFVFKEMPIFGEASEKEARLAIALQRSGGDYLGYHFATMAQRPTPEAAEVLAKARGYKGPAADAERQLTDTELLFKALGLEGTPSFVIGDEVIEGEDMDSLKAKIDQALKAAGA